MGVVVVLAVALSQGGGDPAASGSTASSSSSATSPSASGSAAAVTSAAPATSAGPEGDPAELPPTLAPAPLGGQAEAGDGIVATLPSIEAIEGRATGPGNVNGPALRVTVRIQNGTAQPVSLDGVTVNMYYGAELTPASPLEDPSQRMFSGTVDPGASADGIYVFTVPADARDAVTVEVGYRAGAPFMTWSGAAP